MIPQRRLRPLFIAILVLLILLFYYSVNRSSQACDCLAALERNANWICDVFQGDGSKIQNQRFYRSTVKAIEAQRHAEHDAAAVKTQPEPKPAVPEAPKAEVPKADTVKPNDDSEEMQEIPIAGRTKMTVPKNKGDAPKKEQEQVPEADDHTEAKEELNSILKRAPSMFRRP